MLSHSHHGVLLLAVFVLSVGCDGSGPSSSRPEETGQELSQGQTADPEQPTQVARETPPTSGTDTATTEPPAATPETVPVETIYSVGDAVDVIDTRQWSDRCLVPGMITEVAQTGIKYMVDVEPAGAPATTRLAAGIADLVPHP